MKEQSDEAGKPRDLESTFTAWPACTTCLMPPCSATSTLEGVEEATQARRDLKPAQYRETR